MNTFSEKEETVIKDICDHNGKVVLRNAIIHRTIVEQIIGFNAMACQVNPQIIDSQRVTVHNETYKIEVLMITYLHGSALFSAWVSRQLPWTGTVKHHKDGSFRISDGSGVEISALLQNPGGYWAYIMNHQQEQMYLVKANPEFNNENMQLTHPCLSNTNKNCMACLGDDDVKHKLKKLKSTIGIDAIRKLYFNRFNRDWTEPGVATNNLFYPQQGKVRLQHIYVANTVVPSASPDIQLPFISDNAVLQCVIYEPTENTQASERVIEI